MKDNLFQEHEMNVLKRYRTSSIVLEEDENILLHYASIGFVNFKFNWDTMEEYTYLTPSGQKHYIYQKHSK
jgi:hypothetical protein